MSMKAPASTAGVVYRSETPLHQKTLPTRRTFRRSLGSSTLSRNREQKQQTLTQIRFPIIPSSEDDEEEEEYKSPQKSLREWHEIDGRFEEDGTAESYGSWEDMSERRRKRSRTGLDSRTSPSPSYQTEITGLYVKGQNLRNRQKKASRERTTSNNYAFEVFEDRNNHDWERNEVTNHDGSDGTNSLLDQGLRVTETEPSSTTSPSKPTTPRWRKTLEVPSSQSPPEVLLSASNSPSRKAYGRSPLRERSTNIPLGYQPAKIRKPMQNQSTGSLKRFCAGASSKKSRPMPRYTIPDSDDEQEIGLEDLSPSKSTNGEPSVASSSPPTNHEVLSDADDFWPDFIPSSALPAPHWSQLEHRDVTQYSKLPRLNIDEDDEQELDVECTLQRALRSSRHEQHKRGTDKNVPTPSIRPSQASTVDVTQSSLHTATSHLASSSPPKTSPYPGRVQVASSFHEHEEVQVPSSPQLMAPPLQKSKNTALGIEESQRRVTFSQLVPESLRGSSYHIGPLWWQADYGPDETDEL